MKRFITAAIVALCASLGSAAGEDWQPVGEGTFTDGIFYGMFGGNPPAEVSVQVEQCGGKFRVKGLWPDRGDSTEMTIDMTDRSFGIVGKQYTGVDDAATGPTYMASANWIAMQEGSSRDDFAARYPELIITMSGNIIRFPGNSVRLCWPQYDEAWYQSNRPRESRLTLPESVGTGNIAADTSETVYYTMQGVRLERPEAGVTVIAVTDGRVRKVVFQ